jgi:exodeoxyribonuclease VII large subunit
MHTLLARQRQRLHRLRLSLEQKHPRHRLAEHRTRLARLERRIRDAAVAHKDRLKLRGQLIEARLGSLNPEAVLARGYSIALTPDGRAVRDPAEAPVGSDLTLRVQKGQLSARVIKHLATKDK